MTDQNGNHVQLSYTGSLLSRIQNANHSVELTRNTQGRVISVRDDLGRTVSYGYDDKGMLTQVTDLGGNIWSYQYTGQNQLHRAVDPAERENFKVWYMSDGRVNAIDLPSGRISYVYDDGAHRTTVTDRKSLVSQYFQNAEGITTRVINALGEETSIGLDGSHNVIELRRNGALAEQMQYGPDHRLLTRHSFGASGETVAQYAYDSAGQVTRISDGNGQAREFSYDGQGNVTRVSDENGVQQFGYSAAGDLQAFSSPVSNLQLGYSAEGQVSQFTDSGGTAAFAYAAGRLSQISFADGAWARMQYTPLGLRSKLEYSNGSSVAYTYDPAGNLTATAVVNADGSRDGETLTVDDSYQVTRQLLANGTEVLFGYDKNGNLTEVSAGSSVTRFEYDALNRLTAVVTDAGQRLEYSYEPGERSLVDEYDSGPLSGSRRQDSGLTFAAQWEVFANRAQSSQWGAVRFSEKLGGFLLSGTDGKEVVTPESGILAALGNLRLTDDEGAPLRSRLRTFSRPVNLFFLPGEYATINCCAECPLSRGFVENCDPCDPAPPEPPPPVPGISQDTPLWYFNGMSPSTFTDGATQVTLTATETTGQFKWTVVAGMDKVVFENFSATITKTDVNTVGVKSIKASGDFNDVTIRLTYTTGGGTTYADYTLEVRAPRSLVSDGPAVDQSVGFNCASLGVIGFRSLIPYRILNQFGETVRGSGINEHFITPKESFEFNDWEVPPEIGSDTPEGTFDDAICQTGSTFQPQPTPPQNPLSTREIDKIQQEWFAGSTSIAFHIHQGIKVQKNDFRRYIDHGRHLNVTSPP